MHCLPLAIFAILILATSPLSAADKQPVIPGLRWDTRTPAQVGLSSDKLDSLRDLISGRGCVVRHGYLVDTWGDAGKSSDVASAVKPVLSTLLLFAV